MKADPIRVSMIDISIGSKNNMFINKDSDNILVVLKLSRSNIFSYLHDKVGHPGINILCVMSKKYYWPSLTKDVRKFIKKVIPVL